MVRFGSNTTRRHQGPAVAEDCGPRPGSCDVGGVAGVLRGHRGRFVRYQYLEFLFENSVSRRQDPGSGRAALWHIQRGDIVFPKSVTPERIRENIDIFEFELSAADVEEITVLNKDERTGPDPDRFDGR